MTRWSDASGCADFPIPFDKLDDRSGLEGQSDVSARSLIGSVTADIRPCPLGCRDSLLEIVDDDCGVGAPKRREHSPFSCAPLAGHLYQRPQTGDGRRARAPVRRLPGEKIDRLTHAPSRVPASAQPATIKAREEGCGAVRSSVRLAAWALAESGAERCPQSGADTLRHMAIPSSSAGRVPARSRKPGRPRNPATDGAILDACIDQLDQVGYRALSLSEVARSAGVGKPTLYRRWSSKPELVIATLLHRYGDQPVPDTGSLRGDLIEAQRHTTQLLSDPSTVHVLVALLADLSREPDLDQLWRRLFLAPRRASLEAALRHARERGEWRSDLSTTWAADWLTGPLLSHVLFSRGRLGRRDIERSVDRFIAAFSHT